MIFNYTLKFTLILFIFNCFVSSKDGNKIINTCGKVTAKSKWLNSRSTLTRDQEIIDIKYYDIDLKIDIDSEHIVGNVLIKGQVGINQPDSIELDFSNSMQVDSIYFNNTKCSFDHLNNKIKIPQDQTTDSQGYEFEVVVYYNGEPTSTGFGSFNFDTHNNIPHIWTLSEPYGARDWWPCKDDPSDKADSLEISVTIQKDQIVVSNGLLTEEINVNENEKKYTWFESYPICTYLVSITSYPYTVWHDEYISSSGDTLPLDFYVYPENYDIVRDNYLLTNDMLSVFAEKFGEYPFMNEKYGHAEFGRGGGMEHQTISSMGGYSEWLIAHELGHQWWGDLVTCADFHHIWLNEGFARFSESIWEEAKGGAEAYKDYWRNHTFYGPGTVYVENPISTSQIFNGNLTYNKAGWVVHMLRGVLGDSLFFQSLQAYASDDSLSYNAVTTENFKNVCENISGIPLDSFFQQWIYGEFYPKYSLSWDMIDSDLLSIRIEQVQNWQYFEMPIDLLIYTDLDTIKLTVNNNTQDQEYQIGIDNGFVQRIELDPDNWILKEVQYLSLNGNIPDNYEVIMYPAYPNPFNPKVNIDFFVPDEFGEFQSRIFIYNLSGRLIEELMPMKSYPGINKISWNSLNNASGTYFISIEADKKIHTQKIQLVK